MTNEEHIDSLYERLSIYRSNLSHYLTQAARYGGEGNATEIVVNSIRDARKYVQDIKNELKRLNIDVDDLAGETLPVKLDLSSQPRHVQGNIFQDQVTLFRSIIHNLQNLNSYLKDIYSQREIDVVPRNFEGIIRFYSIEAIVGISKILDGEDVKEHSIKIHNKVSKIEDIYDKNRLIIPQSVDEKINAYLKDIRIFINKYDNEIKVRGSNKVETIFIPSPNRFKSLTEDVIKQMRLVIGTDK